MESFRKSVLTTGKLERGGGKCLNLRKTYIIKVMTLEPSPISKKANKIIIS